MCYSGVGGVADMDEAGGVDVDISWAVDELDVNARILNVEQLGVKAPYELMNDHLWCFTS